MRGKKLRIHRDLSDLVFYSQSVHFVSFIESQKAEYRVMSSFNEKKAVGLVKNNGSRQPAVRDTYNGCACAH